MPSQDSRGERSKLNRGFAALSDPMRRDLIELILANPGISIGDTCQHFKVSRFTVMRHLNVLESAQLLYRERRGALKSLYIDRELLAELSSGWLRRVVLVSEIES